MSWDFEKIKTDVDTLFDKYELPSFNVDEEISFDSLRESSKDELQSLLLLYSQQKIYIEEIIAIRESKLQIQQGDFDNSYQIALHFTVQKYKEKGVKKPTQEELKAEIMATNLDINEANKKIITNKSLLTRLKGQNTSINTMYYTTKQFLNLL